MGKHSLKKLSAFLIVILILFVGAYFILKKPAQPIKVVQKLYFAMGDSVAAGTGLDNPSDTSACDRSNQSYPNIVAAKLSFNLKSVACNGATISSGITGGQTVNNNLLGSQLSQLYALSEKPSLITLTIGANDISWTSFINECYTTECGTSADTTNLDSKLAAFTFKLSDVLSKLESQYKDVPPRVIVTSYYSVFPVTGNDCELLSTITTAEQAWWKTEEKSFEDAISKTVEGFNFAKFASVDFTGHELCTKDPWIQDIAAKAPIHPNADGQAAIARAVADAFSQL